MPPTVPTPDRDRLPQFVKTGSLRKIPRGMTLGRFPIRVIFEFPNLSRGESFSGKSETRKAPYFYGPKGSKLSQYKRHVRETVQILQFKRQKILFKIIMEIVNCIGPIN